MGIDILSLGIFPHLILDMHMYSGICLSCLSNALLLCYHSDVQFDLSEVAVAFNEAFSVFRNTNLGSLLLFFLLDQKMTCRPL